MSEVILYSGAQEYGKSVLSKDFLRNSIRYLCFGGIGLVDSDLKDAVLYDEVRNSLKYEIATQELFQDEDYSNKYFTPKRREMPSGLFAKMMENL